MRYSLMRMNTSRLILTLTLGGTFACTQAIAQPDDSRNQRTQQLVNQLIDQLGAHAWIDRDIATLELASYAAELTLDDLEHALQDQTLSNEQRSRLVHACLERFKALPKGGLGVAFGTVRVGAVEVQPIENNPEFPASAMLIPGDAIAKVDGELLSSSSDLRAHILSRLPGEIIPVTIIRNKAIINLDLPLGSYSKLAGPAQLDDALAMRALELRWARKGIVISHPDEIGNAIDQERWAQAAFPIARATNAQNPGRRYPTAMISGAGQSVLAGPTTFGLGVKTWESIQNFADRASEVAKQILRAQSQSISAKLTLFELEFSTLETQLKDATSSAQRLQISNQIAQLSDQIVATRQQLDALTTEQIELLDADEINTDKPVLPSSP